jgi:transposase InsO family protein
MPNVLNRNFRLPNLQKFGSDITYIRVKEGFLYLTTTVLDLYDRKIIGWSLSSGMSVETSLAAWRMAIKTEASQRDLHSDRGVQYASKKIYKRG